MIARQARHTTAVLTLVVLPALSCAKLETVAPPAVSTAGEHSLVVGKTLKITATTAHGSDSGYGFTSAMPKLAAVDDTGLVTAIAPGETAITVTGTDTKAVAVHPIVVVAASDPTPHVPSEAIPNYLKWQSSAHADTTAEAFNHWNTEGSIPVTCAGCHSSAGFQDRIGADGSEAGKVDKPAPIGSTVECRTCHNPQADALTSVTFPSGVVVDGLGGEARCMMCHQGRASGASVDKAIVASGVATDDELNTKLNFLNIHYFPAAATLFAGRVKGGYQYAGRVYDTRFRHVEGLDTCIGCHDPHAARPRFDVCGSCHAGVTDVDGARKIRMMSSVGRDYDGDGNLTEGIYDELVGARTRVMDAIRRYGGERGTPICYDEKTHPYWFVDGNDDGTCAASETKPETTFRSWTARLMRATYNFQLATKDPGAFAHNAKYIMELLYDSVADLNSALIVKVDMSKAVRGDVGHFDGASEAARHWDENEQVDATCSRCHSSKVGFRFFVEHGVSIEVPETANGLECGTCHTSFEDKFDVLAVASTTFPSGVVRKDPGHDNLCSTCHSGRAAKKTVDVQLAAGKLAFVNVHYLPAATVKLGSAAGGGYEYTGKTYAGPSTHSGGTQCTSCHDPVATNHTFRIADAWDARCKNCHADANGDPEGIRLTHRADYDGDQNTTESLKAEEEGIATKLLVAMRAVAPLCHADGIYPYFFQDTDGDKKVACSAVEAVAANGFKAWTAALVKAAYNYQLSRNEPGAWAHNFDYIGQLLYDSVEDLSGVVAGMTRP